VSRLQRHPIAMTARFRDVLVLTYAFPAALLRALVPSSLALETYGGAAFVAVAVVDMAHLRPAPLPHWTGVNATFVGYRVFVRTQLDDGRVRRGLKVLRTDVDRLGVLAGTRLLTRYRSGLVTAAWRRVDGRRAIDVRSRWHGVDLAVEAVMDDPARPPRGSVFASWQDAAPFSGPLPWTFAPTAAGSSAIMVKGVRSDWRPRPVTVRAHHVGYFERAPFPRGDPVLAAAFHLADVRYSWTAGRDETVTAPRAGAG